MFEPLPSEDCKGLAMKLEVKYIFQTSSPGIIFFFFIHQLSESLEIRKILAKSNMHSRTQSSRTATLTPKSSIQNIQNIQNSFSIKNYQLV